MKTNLEMKTNLITDGKLHRTKAYIRVRFERDHLRIGDVCAIVESTHFSLEAAKRACSPGEQVEHYPDGGISRLDVLHDFSSSSARAGYYAQNTPVYCA